jgi:hypothetical protein
MIKKVTSGSMEGNSLIGLQACESQKGTGNLKVMKHIA